MYAITLYEPWATLVAREQKRWETRKWRYPEDLYNARVAIHAGAEWGKIQRDALKVFQGLGLLLDWPRTWLEKGKHNKPDTLRHVLGSVVLGCQQSTSLCRLSWPRTSIERHLGDYSPGRLGWALNDWAPCTPFKAKGRQRFWHLTQTERDRVLEGLDCDTQT